MSPHAEVIIEGVHQLVRNVRILIILTAGNRMLHPTARIGTLFNSLLLRIYFFFNHAQYLLTIPGVCRFRLRGSQLKRLLQEKKEKKQKG